MAEDLTVAETTVLDMLAQSRVPYVRRGLVDVVAGPGVLDSLVRRNLAGIWSVMAVEEREYNAKQRDWREKRARRVEFASLTPLGTAEMQRDVFQHGDTGQPYLDRRRLDEKGQWMLPTEPIVSRGSGGGSVRQLCPDVIPDQPDEAPRQRRRGKNRRRAG